MPKTLLRKLVGLRILAAALCVAFVLCLATGLQTKLRIGHITWGPTVDFWAMAIAISNIEYGLGGGIGYRKVSHELARQLTGSPDDLKLSEAGLAAVKRPDLITQAIRAAAGISKDQLRPVPLESGTYVTTWAEDVGYADFYNVAFRLFGYGAYSTHYLYIIMFAMSLLLFGFSYWSNRAAIATLVAAAVAFFITCNSGIISHYVPSLASNRFLSTLGIIPLLHLLWALVDKQPHARDVAILVVQASLLSIAISLRSSGSWMLFAILGASVAMFISRFVPFARRQAGLEGRRKLSASVLQPLLVCGIVIVPFVTVAGIRHLQLHSVYSNGDALPHHFRWHSAWLGLTLNPKWKERKPVKEAPDVISDGVGFVIAGKYWEANYPGVSFTSTITGLSKAGLYDRILRDEFLRFFAENPGFILKTYFWYKPINLIQTYWQVLGSVSFVELFVALGAVAFVACMFVLPPGVSLKEAGLALIFMLTFSTLPMFWAYAASLAFADQLIIIIVAGVVLVGIFIRFIGLR
jgi:hypothetical protein